jgi:hypothetical protein
LNAQFLEWVGDTDMFRWKRDRQIFECHASQDNDSDGNEIPYCVWRTSTKDKLTFVYFAQDKTVHLRHGTLDVGLDCAKNCSAVQVSPSGTRALLMTTRRRPHSISSKTSDIQVAIVDIATGKCLLERACDNLKTLPEWFDDQTLLLDTALFNFECGTGHFLADAKTTILLRPFDECMIKSAAKLF